MSLKSFIYSQQLKARQGLVARLHRTNAASETIDPNTFAPTKVLFVLSGLIGDSVMSLPAIEAARRVWAGVGITVLGKRHNRELIEACGCFDEFYEFNADPFSIRKADETRKLEEWLGEQGFDAAFILLGDQFAGLLAKAGIPVRVGVRGTALENCLTHTYDIGSPRTWGATERLNVFRTLGYDVDNAVPRLTADASLKPELDRKLNDLGLRPGERYVVIHPFGSSKRQWWDLDKLPGFAVEIGGRYGLRVVLAGGDKTVLQANSGNAIVNTTGVLSLGELLLLIDGAALVVTTDSGPFHIAGALGRPTVGLFRSRRPEHARQYPTATVVFGRDDGCMTACEWDRCRFDPCRQMTEISVDDVVDAVGARLSNL